MTQPNTYLVTNPALQSSEGARLDEPVTSRTAARLRVAAERAGEPFDGQLTEGQALKRLAYLEELSD